MFIDWLQASSWYERGRRLCSGECGDGEKGNDGCGRGTSTNFFFLIMIINDGRKRLQWRECDF